MAIDAAGSRAALGCGPGDIYVYDATDGQVVAELRGQSGRVLMIGFTADPGLLVSAAADGTVRLWSLTESKRLAVVRADASLHCAAFNAESGMILAGSVAGTVAIRIPSGLSGEE